MATKALAWRSNNKNEESWLSISDLMSGLMMLFLFVAVSYMTMVQKQMSQPVEAFLSLQEELYSDLTREFQDDLPKWNAEIDKKTLSVRFNEPDVLFGVGQATLKSDFRGILHDFFPRYLNIIYSNKYRDNIEEIRIEGHTSTEWDRLSGEDYAYFRNMNLSQARTRAVLEYCMSMIQNRDQRAWARNSLMAIGLSSSKPILGTDGKEDEERSRRVEFRTKISAEKAINEINERS
ncbi:MAG: OmpA family protein [Acidobacteriota bacterium]|jgi:outer membrane protein OmpA-like peptidoglycan-associated protein|nr:OmpA family protein [Acidobacteriota bacterium]